MIEPGEGIAVAGIRQSELSQGGVKPAKCMHVYTVVSSPVGCGVWAKLQILTPRGFVFVA